MQLGPVADAASSAAAAYAAAFFPRPAAPLCLGGTSDTSGSRGSRARGHIWERRTNNHDSIGPEGIDDRRAARRRSRLSIAGALGVSSRPARVRCLGRFGAVSHARVGAPAPAGSLSVQLYTTRVSQLSYGHWAAVLHGNGCGSRNATWTQVRDSASSAD